MTRFGAGNRERKSGRRWRPRGAGGEAHEVAGTGPVYVSFDVDGLDPVYAPGTGTPEVGGFTNYEAQQMLRGLRGLDIVAGDVVEVSPPFDRKRSVGPWSRTVECIIHIEWRPLNRAGTFFSPGRGGEMSETTDAGVDSGRAPNSPRRPHGGGSDPANGVFGLSGQSCPTPPGGAPGRA